MSQNPSGMFRMAPAIIVTTLLVPALYLVSVAPLTRLTFKVAPIGAGTPMGGGPQWLQTYRLPYDFVASHKPLDEPLQKYFGWWMNFRQSFITLIGQVDRQGRYAVASGESLTVSGAILRAGGFAQFASDSKVKVVRKVSGKNVSIIVNLRDVMKKGMRHLDIPVHPGDVIIVPEKIFTF